MANLSILLLSHICHSAFRIFQETYLLRQFTRHKFLTGQNNFDALSCYLMPFFFDQEGTETCLTEHLSQYS